ncbi:hypothetical protein Y032_0013g1918 [Ancylostoma ceylanicum]|uniref:Uncharacterized protein n=1 Tax=Ancylostoma ceylanicum TaxID=53326 RepID=A0A016V9X0_9BILA|nr:hypothetical protein Y032_0013g1918 [Ancylostoma ceylanicum]
MLIVFDIEGKADHIHGFHIFLLFVVTTSSQSCIVLASSRRSSTSKILPLWLLPLQGQFSIGLRSRKLSLMDKDSFDPRTFFALHDLNGDGYWNADELEALFQKELEKVYNETDPDDDPRERMEEMYRMREHVTKQMDKNNDRLISLEEFLQVSLMGCAQVFEIHSTSLLKDTEAQTPDKDPGWKDLGDQQVYTDEELQEFEREYAKQQDFFIGFLNNLLLTRAPSFVLECLQVILSS